MLFAGGFTFSNFLVDVFAVFMFVLWFWFLITVFGDLFRRQDISGVGKAVWVIVLIVLPYFGILVYLISQGPGMAERQGERFEQAGEEMRGFLGFSAADELEELERLKNSDRISGDEYARLRMRAVE